MHRSPPHSILQSPHNDLSKMVQRLCRIPCILTDSDGMCVDHSSGGMCVDHSSRQCFCFVLCRFRWYVLPQRHHYLCFVLFRWYVRCAQSTSVLCAASSCFGLCRYLQQHQQQMLLMLSRHC